MFGGLETVSGGDVMSRAGLAEQKKSVTPTLPRCLNARYRSLTAVRGGSRLMYRMAIIFILAVLLPAAAAATPVPPARRGALPAGAKGPANLNPLRLTIQPEEPALLGPRTRHAGPATGIDAQGHRRDPTPAAPVATLTPHPGPVP